MTVKPYLENVSHIVAGLSAVLVCFSIVYDYSYFSSLSLKFFSMMTLWDHVASTLENSVFFIIGVVGGRVLEKVSDRKEGNKSSFFSILIVYALPLLGVLLMVLSSFSVKHGGDLSSWGFVLVSFGFSWFILNFLNVKEEYRGVSYQVLIVLFLGYGFAKINVESDLHQRNDKGIYFFGEHQKYKILRSFNVGFVSKGDDEKIYFHTWNGDVSFEGKYRDQRVGFLCESYAWCLKF